MIRNVVKGTKAKCDSRRRRKGFELVERGAVEIFVGENWFAVDRPVHSDSFVIPKQRSFVLWSVSVSVFVDEVGRLAEPLSEQDY